MGSIKDCGYNAAAFEAECAILVDKLGCGINGAEWLVSQVIVDATKRESLEQWLRYLRIRKYEDIYAVMREALLLKDEDFFARYEFNWWISIHDTLTYLKLAQERDYDWYFNFLRDTYAKE